MHARIGTLRLGEKRLPLVPGEYVRLLDWGTAACLTSGHILRRGVGLTEFRQDPGSAPTAPHFGLQPFQADDGCVQVYQLAP
jgi:hypothetical protein